MIKVKKLIKDYRRGNETIHALKEISFELDPGEYTILYGPSGAGKTSVLNIVGGMDLPDSGRVEINGNPIGHKNLIQYRRKNIGFIFSEFYLISTLTSLENVLLPQIWTGKSNRERGRELLKMVELEHRMHHFANELSGGEMQRVAIARALVNDPQILIADEPTGRLEVRAKKNILDIFSKLKEQGLAIIIATHDLSLASQADRQIRLSDGKII